MQLFAWRWHNNIVSIRIHYWNTYKLFSICNLVILAEPQYQQADIYVFVTKIFIHPSSPRFFFAANQRTNNLAPLFFLSLLVCFCDKIVWRTDRLVLGFLLVKDLMCDPLQLISHVVCKSQ